MSKANSAAPASEGSFDPYSIEGLVHRHENRQLLLQRLQLVRRQIKDLENEVLDIERTVNCLPYRPQDSHSVTSDSPRINRLAAAGAGGLALPLAVGIMHPLDTVRTTMQARHGVLGFSEAVKALGSRGIARGFGLSFAWACPQGAIRMASYETCKELLSDKFYMKSFGIGVSAVLADFASSVIKVPRELITQRMQTGQYTSSWAACQSILRQDGFSGLFRGYLSTASRDTPFMVLLFFSYEQFKAWKIRLTFGDSLPPLAPWSDAETVLWGGVSGALAAWLTTPFDVIKTRVMTAAEAMTIGQAFRSIGPTGLFAGAGPRSAWWFCVSSVFFATYERLRSKFQQRLE
ncbi:S-adenosylmethionine carrier 1 [Durusdinium trenchii]|uniref:Chloroplastic/mitochondrial (S-adenosylmethionine transporter 1) (AtSAMT1) n=1 Tax=Durusdinium trenchii TaxID=1381693 RepID=A0ABP0RYV7_9DINO